MVTVRDTTFLGRGIYDVVEVARLVGRSPDEVARWGVSTHDRDALLFPRERRLLSFYDLVTAFVVAALRRRGVPLPKVRDARHMLAGHFGVDWPLAHQPVLDGLATSGSDVYVLLGDWIDASRGGQPAIPEVVGPLLQLLDFDAEGMASLWRPVPQVVVNPSVQAGAPCVKGTRIATRFLAELADTGESIEDIADDYDLDVDVVRAALDFERDPVAA